MSLAPPLRLVVVAPDLLDEAQADEDQARLVTRSRQLRIGLLEGGLNLVATWPATWRRRAWAARRSS